MSLTIDFKERKLDELKGQMGLDAFLTKVMGLKRLKSSSQNYIGLCPFHNDSHRSFGVSFHYPHKWGCLIPSCQKGSSIETLVMKMMDVDFNKSQEIIEKYMGYIKKVSEMTLDIPYYDEEEDHSVSKDLLIEYSCGYSTHDYFFKRGLTKEMMYAFQVGYDRYKKRVVFPIFQDKKLINFVGRTIESDVEPKYLIYEEVDRDTFMFVNERLIPKRMPYFIVYEGVLETVYSTQLGIPNCGSLLGAFITKKHVNRMLTYSNEIVSFLDNDDAGKATNEKLVFYVKKARGAIRCVRHLSEDKTKFKDLLDYRSKATIKTMIKIAPHQVLEPLTYSSKNAKINSVAY